MYVIRNYLVKPGAVGLGGEKEAEASRALSGLPQILA